MSKKFKDFIEEEINSYADKLKLDSGDEIKDVIMELFDLKTNKMLNNIGSVDVDSKDEIGSEMWSWFVDVINSSIAKDEEFWLQQLKNYKLKIITYKYFTRNNLMDLRKLENYLKVNIKPYFSALQNFVDEDDFNKKLFNLPTDIMFCLVRYMFMLSPDINKKIVVNNEDLRKNVKNVMEKRIEFAKEIGKISKGYKNTLDLKVFKELLDNGAFFEDNFINRGVNEYISKLVNHKEAVEKIKDLYPTSFIRDVKKQVESCAAYVSHVTAIKTEQGAEYFTFNGLQLGKRFDNEIDVIEDGIYDGMIVDNKSRLKEPNGMLRDMPSPWDAVGQPIPDGDAAGSGAGSAGGPTGAGGMGAGPASFGGGDISAPSSEQDFAGEDAAGTVPGADDVTNVSDDGTPPATDEEGFPEDFGTEETNTEKGTDENTDEENKDDKK